MRYKHVIWDFNGTLLDDADLNWRIGNEMLIADGRDPIPFTQYLEWVEYPIQRYYEKLGYHLSKEDFIKISDVYHHTYNSRLHEAGLQAGVRDTLQAVQDAGLTQSILSAYHQDGLDNAVEMLGIRDFFMDIIGLSDKQGGSKVQAALDWMERRGLDPTEIVMVGDTLHDAEVTFALGCDCILFSGGHNARRRLIGSGMPVIDHMRELFPLLAC